MDYVNTILIDQETLFRESLAFTLTDQRADILIMHSFPSGNDCLDVDIEGAIDLIMLDLNLIDIDGLDLIPLIRKHSKSVKLIVLTRYSKSKLIKEALKKGADGYLLKTSSLQNLYDAIDAVLEGKTFVGEGLHITPPPNQSPKKVGQSGSGMIYEDRYMIKDKLTRREQEILGLIAQAKNNKEIAAELYISDQTVGVHRKNMMRKLGVHNTVHLVKMAIEYQLVD